MEHFMRSVFWLKPAIYVNILLSVFIPGSHQLCKWSNENCNDDLECCSKRCEQAHVGTSARCKQSNVQGPCYADYHCVEYLTCGGNYQCCSPFWGVCTDRTDCCDPDHVCRSEQGFYYRLCLGPKNSGRASFRNANVYAILMCLIAYCLYIRILQYSQFSVMFCPKHRCVDQYAPF